MQVLVRAVSGGSLRTGVACFQSCFPEQGGLIAVSPCPVALLYSWQRHRSLVPRLPTTAADLTC